MTQPGPATRLIEGVERFQKSVFTEKESLFHQLEKGQSPGVLFITCSDSRIDPNLLTLTDPGELFVLRNAGNLIPPYDTPGPSGAVATVEYAVLALKVRDIIVCGHSKCGAIAGLLAPEHLAPLPAVKSWLSYAEGVYDEVQKKGLEVAERLNYAVERNVLKQLEHLRTHPSVIQGLAAGTLRLHGWIYHFEAGKVLAHDPNHERFVSVAEAWRQPLAAES